MTTASISATLKKEGLFSSRWSSPWTPWKMMGKPWSGAGWGRVRPGDCLAGPGGQGPGQAGPHLLGQLRPGTVGVGDAAVSVLLQLPLVEQLIGDLEDGGVGPGGQQGTCTGRRAAPHSSGGTRGRGLEALRLKPSGTPCSPWPLHL